MTDCPHRRPRASVTETDHEVVTASICDDCGETLRERRAPKIRPSRPGTPDDDDDE